MRTYRALYRSKSGNELVIKSVRKPPRTRTFRSATGRKNYKLVELKSTKREVIVVAKTKNRKKAVDQDEIEEIEALEELEEELEEDEDDEDVEEVEDDDEDEEDDEDEDEPDDEDEDDEDEEDEEPAPKRSRKSKKAPAKKKQSRAAADGKVGTAELAEHLGIDGRSLRMLLRKHQIPTDPDSGRYQWPSLENKTVKRIEKLVKSGEHKKAQREGLDKLKASKGKSKKSKDTPAKTTKSTKSSGTSKKKKSKKS